MVHRRQWSNFTWDGYFFLNAEGEENMKTISPNPTIQTTNGVVASNTDAKAFIQPFGTSSHLELVDDSPSILSSGR